jgi:hypothetical protein
MGIVIAILFGALAVSAGLGYGSYKAFKKCSWKVFIPVWLASAAIAGWIWFYIIATAVFIFSGGGFI